ncbi:MAG: acyltransferase [Oscillospiraceae bacterium]|jgi:acetyltransferase-like isoleucine patch superfamily enzyme|nr:acyltransferase [Oscillospiraceae bacterium]
MQTITSTEHIAGLSDNQIVGGIKFDGKSKIQFKGKGNILAVPGGVAELQNCAISFNGDNSLVVLSASYNPYALVLSLWNNSSFYSGRNNYFNGRLNLQCSEQANIFIGSGCLFSTGVLLRTGDVHLIFDVETHKRTNFAKSIYVGDHVWIGQDAKIWKNTHIGSGSIIGTEAVVAGKRVPSNTAWGGNPARQLKSGVFFHSNSSHAYTATEVEKWSEYNGNEYIYARDNTTLDFDDIEKTMRELNTAEKRKDFLIGLGETKNRFTISTNI